MESIVRTSDFEVDNPNGRAILVRPKSKFARTYVDRGENKTDVVSGVSACEKDLAG
jgi:hypothetical protein